MKIPVHSHAWKDIHFRLACLGKRDNDSYRVKFMHLFPPLPHFSLSPSLHLSSLGRICCSSGISVEMNGLSFVQWGAKAWHTHCFSPIEPNISQIGYNGGTSGSRMLWVRFSHYLKWISEINGAFPHLYSENSPWIRFRIWILFI